MIAHASRMGQDNIPLERSEIRARYAHARQLAEAGIDSVNRLTALQNAPDRIGAGGDGVTVRGVERDGLAAPDRTPVAERSLARSQSNRHCPLHTRACKGLKPSL